MSAQNAQPSPRFTLRNMHVMVDRKVHPRVNMNIQEVLLGGMPEWMTPGQRVEFSFVINLKDWERSDGAKSESWTAKAIGLRRFIRVQGGWQEIDYDGWITGKLK